ncbi:MAG TPA: DUF2911 domain-containing protein [bacterium]|nr:DUF2911 domain-containing protein [bacterium]HMY34896.1 DUF2911 domain-containing protein [bacterium]HMZ03783.1 DUF2911 domain-containing protein [bacterium]HNB07929.1 DUF2911 domain-containing protein [bacterium]HNB58237.1 DUF2911 domain-containing protein [bacterium]
MKKTLRYLAFSLMLSGFVFSQDNKKPSPPAKSEQKVGSEKISINYSQPSVKSRKIWGELVPFGLTKNRDGKMIPWRAGANENTTFTVSKDVKIEGQTLKAGTYGLHMIPGESEFVVIFNKSSTAWGSYSYDQNEDALRVTVKKETAKFQEVLTYGFESVTDKSCTVYLHWELVKIPFKIEF